MKKLLFSFLFTLFLPLCLFSQQKPNVIVILADDLGNADVGYHHQRNEIPTPNVDQIAHTGVQFSAGYVTAPVCGPSRAGLLTGRYQQSFGFDDNPGPFRANPDVVAGIPVSVPLISEYLKQQGYKTACIGKWHVGHEKDAYFPTNRGFDYFFGFLGGAADYYPENNNERKLFKNNTPVEYEGEYLTDAFGREAADYIKRNKDNPFFVYLPFNAVHGPLQEPPAHYMEKFSHMPESKRRILCAMQYAMDANVGKVLAALEEEGLRDNTLIFFVSDNGGKIKGNFSYNDPYRGEKGTLYEGGVRLPYCISWPNGLPQGKTYDKPVSTLDILPTILSVINAKVDKELSGTNLIPYITDKDTSNPHEYLYWRINNNWSIRDADWKLVFNKDSKQPQLFNISKDYQETKDLYHDNPKELARLKKEFQKWSDQVGKAQWGWSPKVGKFVHHPAENFEGINSEAFVSKGAGAKVSHINNPHKSKLNSSDNVLEVSSNKNGVEWGTSARVSQFIIKDKQLKVKVFVSEEYEIKAELKSKKALKVPCSNYKLKMGEWNELTFDFNEFDGPVNTISFLFKPKSNASMHTVYIDDICFDHRLKE